MQLLMIYLQIACLFDNSLLDLLQVLKMMVGKNLNDVQLQQIVDKTILYLDKVWMCMTNIFVKYVQK